MTTELAEAVNTALADKARGAVTPMTTKDAHHTNVYVLIEFSKPLIGITAIYGPFRSFNAAKDWGIVYSENFTIKEIMRPIGVEAIGFIDTTPAEPTLEDQGIHEKQSQIGDYIDPSIGQ